MKRWTKPIDGICYALYTDYRNSPRHSAITGYGQLLSRTGVAHNATQVGRGKGYKGKYWGLLAEALRNYDFEKILLYARRLPSVRVRYFRNSSLTSYGVDPTKETAYFYVSHRNTTLVATPTKPG
jgi:hypothetical protein